MYSHRHNNSIKDNKKKKIRIKKKKKKKKKKKTRKIEEEKWMMMVDIVAEHWPAVWLTNVQTKEKYRMNGRKKRGGQWRKRGEER